ncbi:MAG: ComEC/Rec2 family competence protein [Nocardioidaceae bacterium]
MAASEREPLDLRLAPAALAAWGSAALGLGWSPGRAVAAALLLWAAGAALLGGRRISTRGRRLAVVVTLVAAGGALAAAGLRADAVRAGPLGALASEGASVHLSGQVLSDPVAKDGTFAPYVVMRVIVHSVTARGVTTSVRTPVLVIGDPSWLDVRYGEEVAGFGHLQEPEGPDLAAVLVAAGSPSLIHEAGWLEQQVAKVRGGLTDAGSPLAPPPQALLPALVDGDVTAMPEQTTADFKTAGLTHLLAVSGSNLTLVLGFVLLVARWARVRAHGLTVVGGLAVVFFVLLARPQPSVLRAAAMGVVALAGLSSGSRARGVRVLCVAVVALVTLDPWLARSIGFLLSTLATIGILVLAPPWRERLARWMPRPVAEAVAVPLAAQVVCTPVVAAISGQVSVVAVVANMAVAPAIGPATVASLLAGLAAMVSSPLGHLAGRVAGVPLWWIVWVAEHGARVAGASISWRANLGSIAFLALVCLAIIAVLPVVLPRRLPCLAVVGLLVLVLFHPLDRFGWPPSGWVMVMCDVGQGDGLVLNAGHGVAVVVDTGLDPASMARCLQDLEISRVQLVVLTHFHADHVDGLPAVLDGWPVSEIEVTSLPEPVDRYRAVVALARTHRAPMTVAVAGERRRVGQLVWRVLGPPEEPDRGSDEGGSAPNNASIIMLLRVAGMRILLAGDAEPEEEDAIMATGADLRVDVLKEPHHGSAAQEPAFLASTHAAVSMISVGADNPYGHPTPQTLTWLRQLGMAVYRTDLDGDIALVVRDRRLSVVTGR